MFYNIFLELCVDKGVKPGRAADEMKINRATVTSWKKQGYTPRGATLNKVCEYFGVPSNLLLEQQPFTYWEDISSDWASFFKAIDISTDEKDFIELVYGIDTETPDSAQLLNLIAFVNDCVDNAVKHDDGSWSVQYRPLGKAQKDSAAESGVTDEDIKFALFGGAGEITEAMYEEVKNFAAYVRQREMEKKKKE